MEDNRCVACGSIIPEGRQVCPNCESETWEKYERLRKEQLKERQTYTDQDGEYWAVGHMDNFTGAVKGMAIDKLAELEDKIENGTLVELPCKVGDKVYRICGTPKRKFIKEKICWGYMF